MKARVADEGEVRGTTRPEGPIFISRDRQVVVPGVYLEGSGPKDRQKRVGPSGVASLATNYPRPNGRGY